MAPKCVDFSYDADGRVSTISRYDSLDISAGGPDHVRLRRRFAGDRLTTQAPATAPARLHLDLRRQQTRHAGGLRRRDEELSYDATGQLTGVTDGENNSLESHAYDQNGNANVTGDIVVRATGCVYDGTYHYSYDAEGNRTARWTSSDATETAIASGDTDITVYTWDNRDRMTSATTMRPTPSSAAPRRADDRVCLRRIRSVVAETVTNTPTDRPAERHADGLRLRGQPGSAAVRRNLRRHHGRLWPRGGRPEPPLSLGGGSTAWLTSSRPLAAGDGTISTATSPARARLLAAGRQSGLGPGHGRAGHRRHNVDRRSPRLQLLRANDQPDQRGGGFRLRLRGRHDRLGHRLATQRQAVV